MYRSIADALAEDIASGRLPVGTRLPTHRDLAYRLKVTVGTVTRAYTEAERRGLIGGEVGRGTFVLGRKGTPADLVWYPATEPQVVNMSLCEAPCNGAEQNMAATVQDITEAGLMGQLMTYAPHAGLPTHRAAGARWLTRYRIDTPPESVVITVGAQNGVAVALAAVARPGDVVLTEHLTYFGIKALSATFGLHLEGVAMDDDGLLPEAFDAACRRLAPKALYTVPTLHNPTTAIMPAGRRREIAEIARRYGVTIIEDDVFGFLVPDNCPPIQTLAPDITLYISSLSKSVAAGLRIGYVVTPPALIARLEAVIRALNYSAPALMSEVASRWIEDGRADRFAMGQREEAHARQALARRILPGAVIEGHPWGQHLWMILPEPWRRESFVAEALSRGVAITSADAFIVGRAAAPHAVRLSLCMPRSRDDLARGLAILTGTLNSPADALRSIM